MGRLVYIAIASLDGYISDRYGRFDWAMPDEAVHAFVNDLERPIGTYLYGRRLYETMASWQTMDTDAHPAVVGDFAQLWRAADKVVYSTTLAEVTTPKTQLRRAFDATAVARLKAESVADISIGGARLAAAAFHAGLVDEVHLLLSPVSIGDGHPALPANLMLRFDLLDQRSFANGVVYLHYRVKSLGQAPQ